MRDVLVIAGVIAFFLIGAAYIALCARILADTGDIDQANTENERHAWPAPGTSSARSSSA